MSSASTTTKTGSGTQSGAAKNANISLREPLLTKLEGASTIVRFNQDWAHKCARDKDFAPFVRLFEDNLMPEAKQVQIDFSAAPESSKDALQLHAFKLYVSDITDLAKVGRELYQIYWMSLSLTVQLLIASKKDFGKIKEDQRRHWWRPASTIHWILRQTVTTQSRGPRLSTKPAPSKKERTSPPTTSASCRW